MKKVVLALALTMSVSAQAAYVEDGTLFGVPLTVNVGEVDTFLFEGEKLGSTAAEQTWVNDQLGMSGVTWDVKVADVSYQETNLDNVFAFDLLLEPEYFIIKNSTRVALFENVALLSWGVFDMSLLSEAFHFGDEYTISHVTEFDASGGTVTVTSVSEPLPLALIGIGLLGMALVKTKYG